MRLLLVVLVFSAACSPEPFRDSSWTEQTAMAVARSEHPAVELNGELIVVGGLIEASLGRTSVTDSVEAYDPFADRWRSLPDLPEPRHHAMATVLDGRLFVIGGFSAAGFDAVDTMWELVEGRWDERRELPVPLGAAAAVTLDGRIYLVGGSPAGGLMSYDRIEDEWSILSPPGQAREHLAAVVVDGRIWAIAGRWEGAMLASVEIYDPDGDVWAAGPELGEARSGFGAAASGGMVVAAGGEVFDPARSLDSVEVFIEGSWLSAGSLPVPLHGNPLQVVDGVVYLPGGSTRAGAVDNPGALWSIELRSLTR